MGKKNTPIGLSSGPGSEVQQVKIAELFNFEGTNRVAIDEASAGDIVVFSGLQKFNIGDTLVDPEDPRPLPAIEVEKPTMSMTFGVNKSPFAGQAGKLLTSRQIKDRLDKELETNVALHVESTDDADTFLVSGRGLLHLTVLIESMRREGFEIMVGPPVVIETEIDGQRQEPFEMVDIEIPEEFSGSAINLLNNRKGCMTSMSAPTSEGLVTIQYEVPSRGMNGVKSQLLSASRGLVVMTSTFAGYRPYAGDFGGRDRGNLLSVSQGTASVYSVNRAQERAAMFASPGDPVYLNQIVGISARPQDLEMDLTKTKKLDNMRSAGNDDTVKITPAKKLTLEEAVEFIVNGEFVEVTPDAIRMGMKDKKNNRKR